MGNRGYKTTYWGYNFFITDRAHLAGSILFLDLKDSSYSCWPWQQKTPWLCDDKKSISVLSFKHIQWLDFPYSSKTSWITKLKHCNSLDSFQFPAFFLQLWNSWASLIPSCWCWWTCHHLFVENAHASFRDALGSNHGLDVLKANRFIAVPVGSFQNLIPWESGWK